MKASEVLQGEHMVKYFLCIYTKEVTFTLWFYEGLYIYLVLIDKKNALI